MAMTPEAKIVRDIRRLLKSRGVPHLKMHGGPMMEPGIPDLLMCFNGHLVWLEVKSATGQVSRIQQAFGERWRAGGASWAVVRSVEDVESILKWAGC